MKSVDFPSILPHLNIFYCLMNNTDHVFQLIRSMTKNEKRYFRLEVSKYGGSDKNDYLKLYDCIDGREDYDEADVKASLRDEKLVKRFSAIKNYLYNILLQTLTNYHAERNSTALLCNLLQQIDILFGRGLYKQSYKLLQKAQKIAAEYQRTPFKLILVDWEQRFADLEEKFNKLENRLQELIEEENGYIKELHDKIDLEQIHLQTIHQMYQRGTPRNEEEREPYRKFLQHPILQKDHSQSGWYNQNAYYSATAMCYYMLGETERSKELNTKRIEMLESNPQILMEENVDYSVAMYNYIQILSNTGKYDEAIAALEKVRQFTESPQLITDERSKEFFFLILYYHSTRLYLLLGEFAKISALDAELKKKYKELNEKPNKNRLFFMIPLNMTVGHFILGEHVAALYWARVILNDKHNTIRHDILGFVRILHLLIQYELKNYAILEHSIESTQRYLQEHDKFMDFEYTVLRLVRKLLTLPDFGTKDTSFFKKTKEELDELATKDNYTQQLMQTYHLTSWLESKLSRRPFLDLVLEKIQK